MIWVLMGVGWLLAAVLVALLIGRAVHLADLREHTRSLEDDEPNIVAELRDLPTTAEPKSGNAPLPAPPAAPFTVPKPRTPGMPWQAERPSAGKAPRSESQSESDHPGS